MIKLIATDMDGTFLDSEKQFSTEFIDLFYQMQAKGIQFVIASGNQYYRLFQKFLPLSEQMYFVAENGSYIAQGATELYCNIIQPETVEKIKAIIAQTPRVFMVLCGRKSAYIHKDYFAYRHEIKKYYCAYCYVNDYGEIDDDIMKVAIFDPQYQIQDLAEGVRAQLPDDVKLATSGNEWMDIQNVEANKGLGIQFLQMILEIEPDECAAFGDQMNDYELLKQVKYSYAMANAIDPIKDISYQVIGSNEEQGVIQKIKEILNENDG